MPYRFSSSQSPLSPTNEPLGGQGDGLSVPSTPLVSPLPPVYLPPVGDAPTDEALDSVTTEWVPGRRAGDIATADPIVDHESALELLQEHHHTAQTRVRRPAMLGLPPKPANTRYQLLDPLRGMACLMLMMYHSIFYAEYSWQTGSPATWSWGGLGINLVSRLWIGVPIFFVISGYCIAASLDSLRRRPHCLREFYWRRMRRIYPPLWAGLLLGVAVTLAVSCHGPTRERCLQLPRLASFTLTDWLANATGTTTWLPQLSGEDGQHLLLNVWTLCYEEQFYAVAGLLLLFSARRMFLAAYVIAVASIVIRHVCRWYEVPIQGFFFDGHWLMFACGILLYQQLHYLSRPAVRTASIALALGAAYGLMERVLAPTAWDRHVGEYILVACVAAVGLRRLKRWDQSKLLGALLAPFRWIGQMSFSLYLTHFPITVLAASLLAGAGVTEDSRVLLITLPVCLLLSFPLGWLFYQKVERRFLNSVPGS